LSHLENTLDTSNARVILLGDFNAHGFNQESRTPLMKCQYYSKLKEYTICPTTYFLGLRQCVEAVDNLNVLDLVFANFADLKSAPADSGFAAPDIDIAVASLNAAVRSAMEQAIHCGYRYKSKFPHWFSYNLRHYITKKNDFHHRFKNNPSDYFYDRFSYYRKLVKNTIKSDRLRWLKTVDNNLKSQPQHFWKYISNFRKHRSGSIHLEVDGTHRAQPEAVADAFAKHFQSVYNNHFSKVIHPVSQSSEFVSLAPISDADVYKAIKRLKPSKSVGLDGIPGFIIKGCAGIFIPILRHIFNLSLTQQYFPAASKGSAVVPVFKSGNHAAVSNYRPISITSNFSKLFKFIIHDHFSHFAKFNSNQHDFTRKTHAVSVKLIF
ncbi:hypothetical protein B7P43_G11156, partial [Cryptotermes secundus]